MSAVTNSESVQVRFHAITAGGEAVGRTVEADGGTGKTVFTPFAAPGELAEVAVKETKKSFARGEVIRLLEPSPERVAAPCPYYRPETPSQSCGGCQIQHLSYAAQLEAKRRIVKDALERIGGLWDVEVAACVASPEAFHYRNKADFVVGTQAGRPEVGFFARESHDLIDIAECPIQGAENNAVLGAVRRILAADPEWAFDAERGTGDLRRLVVRTSSQGQVIVTLVTNRPKWLYAGEFSRQLRELVPSIVGVLHRGPREDGGARVVSGQDWLEENVNGLALRVRGDGFFQVNRVLTPELVSTTMQLAEPKAGMRALDLYCGVGLFGLHLARAGAKVTGIEAYAPAIVDAKANAQRVGANAEFFVGDAAQELKRFRAGEFDLVLLDPPRAGAAECVPGILRVAPAKVVYVSCDPATLARDVKALVAGGYRVQGVVPLDMFPQTGHVETVVALGR